MTLKEREYFLALRDSVVGCDVMVDKLIIKDVQGSNSVLRKLENQQKGRNFPTLIKIQTD